MIESLHSDIQRTQDDMWAVTDMMPKVKKAADAFFAKAKKVNK